VGEEVAVARERNAVGLIWVTKNRWMWLSSTLKKILWTCTYSLYSFYTWLGYLSFGFVVSSSSHFKQLGFILLGVVVFKQCE